MELGFDACAFTLPDAIPEAGERLRTWLTEGSHGDMIWMAETAERRADPSALWTEVQSIIMLGMNYGPAGDPLLGLADTSCGNISVYARGRDYHEVIKGKLKQLGSFIAGVFASGRDESATGVRPERDTRQKSPGQNFPPQGEDLEQTTSNENPPRWNGNPGQIPADENPLQQAANFAKSQSLPPSQASQRRQAQQTCQGSHPQRNSHPGQTSHPSETSHPSHGGHPGQTSSSPTFSPPPALKVFVDTAPVMEKPLAEASGLGWQGKHTNLVSQEFGSWLFLGAIFTNQPLEADTKASDHCGTCHACIDICPTSAFPRPYQLDARRCISYLTIEHKGHIPLEFRKAMGNRIYGCDDCLAICPWNKFAHQAQEAKFVAREELNRLALSDLLNLDDPKFRSLFSASPVKRIGHVRFQRNVLIAAGNSQNDALADLIIAKLADASPLIRAMAVWALGELLPYDEFEVLHRIWHGREQDEAVVSEWSRRSFNESTFLS